MSIARDSVRITGPAIQVIDGLVHSREQRHMPKSGPVDRRNHLDGLSPEMQAYVIERCDARGVAVTQVRVVSPTEVIIP